MKKEKTVELADDRKDKVEAKTPLMERSHIKKDTFLNCWCPHCDQGLNEDDKTVFQIINIRGEKGISRVTPSLNVLDRESTIHVDDDEELADVLCPHCNTSLIVPDMVCKEDGSKLVSFYVSVSDSKKLQLFLCVRRSCRWYTMSEEDNERLILRDSHEW